MATTEALQTMMTGSEDRVRRALPESHRRLTYGWQVRFEQWATFRSLLVLSL